MARPNRQGCDYFPLDVHLDDKFKFIEIKYGLEGFALLIKLMQKIYSYGYWYKWTEDEALLFADETRSNFETVNNVVNESIKRGIFDDKLYQSYNILTSTGIQKRYKEIVRRRKDVEVTEEYLLIDDTLGVNDDINPTSSEQNDNKSTQSKEKEKVKESKQKKKPTKTKSKYAEYVTMTDEEYKKLIEKHGETRTKRMIEVLDNYKGSKGREYKSDYRAILSWVEEKVMNEQPQQQSNQNIKTLDEEDEYDKRYREYLEGKK